MPATTQSGPARANVNRSHKYHRPAANAAGKQVGPSSDNLGGHRVSDNDGPASRECGLICPIAYITIGFQHSVPQSSLNIIDSRQCYNNYCTYLSR